jgi:hypothetical protein
VCFEVIREEAFVDKTQLGNIDGEVGESIESMQVTVCLLAAPQALF